MLFETLSVHIAPPTTVICGGTVIPVSVCLSVCLSVCVCAGYLKKLLTDLNQILWNGALRTIGSID